MVPSFLNSVPCIVDESFRTYALGDRAITVEWGRVPDPKVHDRLIALHAHLYSHPFPGFVESVPAYVTLTVFFDPLDAGLLACVGEGGVSDWVSQQISARMATLEAGSSDRKTIKIPVCYDPVFGPDQQAVASFCGLSLEDLIEIHISVLYRVYMIGFVPGFPYLGMTDPRLDVPRKLTPAMQVAPGSVAIAGRQTGIYPISTPGGWQIIGRTPLRMFDPHASDPFLLKPGMDVRFERIDLFDFEKLSRL